MLAVAITHEDYVLLLLGILLLLGTVSGMQDGTATLVFRGVKRSEGYLYWCAIVIQMAAAFICLAYFVMLAEGISRDRRFIFLVMGLSLTIISLEGIRTGSAILFVRDVTRSEDGYLYWCAIGIGLTFGIGSLVTSVITLFAPQLLH